jgi:peptidylprolyl isomerase
VNAAAGSTTPDRELRGRAAAQPCLAERAWYQAAPRRGRRFHEARMLFISRRAFLAVSLAALAAPALADDDKDNTLVLATKHGKVVIRLRPDLAPKTVAQIKSLTKRKFYDGIVFHRVIPDFMAQTGDPTGTGSGGSDLPDIPAEFTSTHFKRGTVGMARSSDPNSANSQFFICLGDASFLDNKYTVFGEVVSGMDAVDKIKAGTADNNGAVDNPDKIVTLRLASDAKAKPKPKATDAPAAEPTDTPTSQD